MLIDTHCHLDDERLYCDAENIINSMAGDNLYAVVSGGSDYETSVRNFELANRFSSVYSTVGIHPENCHLRKTEHYDSFIKMAECEKVVAVGEVGLDYHYESEETPRELQQKILIEQIELAHFLKLPIVFHVRDAYLDFKRIISERKNLLEYGGVLHCYSGSAEYFKELMDFDFYYGFDGPITFKNAREPVRAVETIPLDRLLVETDSPYLAPTPLRGSTNLPKNVRLVAEKMAEIRGVSFDEISEITTNNAKRLYKRIK